MTAGPPSDQEAGLLLEFTEGVKGIDELRAAIAEVAYYRAEQRDFETGYDMLD